MGRGQQAVNRRTVSDHFSAIFGNRRGTTRRAPKQLAVGDFLFTLFEPDPLDGPETSPFISLRLQSGDGQSRLLLSQLTFPDARRSVGMEIESAVVAGETPTPRLFAPPL